MPLTTTALEVTYLSTTSLKPHPKNPRIHTDKQVGQIAQSIEAFGFNVPILVDNLQNVVAGHGRLLAARKLGWNTVPVIKLKPSHRIAVLGIPDRGQPSDRKLLQG